jgi:ABC-type glucose/galactose transport system permease subunit
LYAPGYELEVIASVVMGGTMLTGGSGYVFGTLFGVMVLGVTQALIQFIGSLSSWWTKIVIGVLTLVFIGVQTILANRKGGRQVAQNPAAQKAFRRRQMRLGIAAGVIFVVILAAFVIGSRLSPDTQQAGATSAACDVKPFRKDEAASFIADGALIAYNRTAGPQCVDEIFAIYPDGRVLANDGVNKIEAQVTPEEVTRLVTAITGEYRWFTNDIYDTYHNPCRQCFTHYIVISYDGQEKAATAVDGGTDMPPAYGLSLALIRNLLPEMPPAP